MEKTIQYSDKEISPKVLGEDRVLIASLFDASGKVVLDKRDKRDKIDCENALKKKDSEQPLPLAASAWFELRIAKKVSKTEPVSFSMLSSTVGEMVKLTVRSMPKDAKVYLRTAGNYVGDTEVRQWVRPGKIRIMMRLYGYADVDEQVSIGKKSYVYSTTLKRK